MKYPFSKIMTAMLVGACLSGAAHAQKTLVYCSEASPENFSPNQTTAGTTLDAAARNIFERLVEFKLGTTEIIPGLAESWEVSDDKLEYTFKLRSGVKLHATKDFTPSRDLNADDVLYSFNRQWKEDHVDHKLGGGTYEYFQGMDMPALLKDIVKVDDMTVKFVLNKPEAPFLANMAMGFASIMSAEYAETMRAAGKEDKIDQLPVGTGPFQLVNYQKDAVIRYKAHPDYWRGKSKLDNLIFAITPDASVRYAKLKAGECHVMPYPNPADVEAMKADESITMQESQGLNVGYLAFNTAKKPFDDKRVRQALNMAINKQSIIDAVFLGSGQIAKNPIPPTMWSYNDAVTDYNYDPEAAKALLAEAGVENLKTNIWAMPVQRPYNPDARRMAELMQADLAKVGVEAEIVSYEWGEYLKRSKAGEHDMVLLGWTGDNGDPDNFLNVLLGCSAVGGGNRAQWCHKPFDDLLQQAKAVTDIGERTKLYEQAQVIFKEEAPWATIAHSLVFMPMRKEVKNYVMDPLGGHVFYDLDLED
jgi:dipeptide transport system substrate-binding protein